MFAILGNRTYRRLFGAQLLALVGTGLMTVALALLAYDLAGDNAGVVLGTALAIKMIAYVVIAPVAGGFAARLPRRHLLVGLDLIRASVALALPFVGEVWQVYVLIALLQSASAAFTPTFQATIADILTDEEDYTRALSLSRLAYDLENLLSPMLAAALVALIGFHWLFAGTVMGFLMSAALVLSAILPAARMRNRRQTALQGTTRGIGIYLATPRLRGLLALNLAVAAAGAMVIVNTVVIVRGLLGLSDASTAIAFAAFGGGSMFAALLLPKLLVTTSDRSIMVGAAALMPVVLAAFAIVAGTSSPSTLWPALLTCWALLGVGYAAAQVPTGRLLRRSVHDEDRPAIFAAQFALSHACWLITYPLAGWLGSTAGIPVTLMVLATIAAVGAAAAVRFWPLGDPQVVPHAHADLPADHPHLTGAQRRAHAHAYVIDDLHPYWPTTRQ